MVFIKIKRCPDNIRIQYKSRSRTANLTSDNRVDILSGLICYLGNCSVHDIEDWTRCRNTFTSTIKWINLNGNKGIFRNRIFFQITINDFILVFCEKCAQFCLFVDSLHLLIKLVYLCLNIFKFILFCSNFTLLSRDILIHFVKIALTFQSLGNCLNRCCLDILKAFQFSFKRCNSSLLRKELCGLQRLFHSKIEIRPLIWLKCLFPIVILVDNIPWEVIMCHKIIQVNQACCTHWVDTSDINIVRPIHTQLRNDTFCVFLNRDFFNEIIHWE